MNTTAGLTELSLFTGAGGGVWASKLLRHRIVGYVEKDEYCQKIIRQRIRDGYWDDAPLFDDVRTFDGLPYRGRVDIVSGGFPCQPFSTAGKRLGAVDERNCWPEIIRVVREVRPRFVFIENSSALLNGGYWATILYDIFESGYDVKWKSFPAREISPHKKRDRIWAILSHTSSSGLEGGAKPETAWAAQSIASTSSWWSATPEFPRVVNGFPDRVNRTRALGNGQVPAVAVAAWRHLTAGLI